MSSKLLEQKPENHEIRMLSCGVRLKADENWMSAETSSVVIWRATSVQSFQVYNRSKAVSLCASVC